MSSALHHNMSSTNSSDNTEVAVIGTPSPTKHAQDAQGRPTIGKNFYINRGKEDEDEASTLSSISGGVTNISKAQFSDFPERYDVESGVAVQNNTFEVIYGRENSYTDDKSSLSSLTDNYPSKGRFVKFGRKGALATFGFQTQLDNIVDTSPSRETKNTNRSPWYVQSPQNIETNEIPNLGQGSDNTSSSSSINNIPEKELMTSFTRDHLDDLVRYPPPKPPPLQRLSSSFHRHASDLDSSRAGRSEGFLTYVQEQYILSRRRKLISGVIVVFFICVIVIVAVAFNTQNNSNVNEEEANTIYQVEQPHDHDTLSSAGNSAFNETVLEDLSSVEHDDDTNDVSSGTSTTAAVILTTDPTEQISQVTESTTTTTATTSDTPSTLTGPTIPGWLNDLLALASTTTTTSTITTTLSTTTTASTTTSQKTPTISPTYKPTFRPSISPSTSIKESPTTAPALSSLSLKAISDTSIFKNRPTKNFASTSYLAVKNDAKASSFVRFDVSNTSGNTVSRAILRLFSIVRVTNTDNDVIGGLSRISVDSLPLAGKWDESSITYDTQPELTDAFTVGSLSVEDYPYSESNRLQRVHEVDVTAAFRNSADTEGLTTFSFMLYSDESSTGRVDFASNESGFNGPELVIELSDTTYPTKSPSTGSSTSTSSSVPSTMPSTTQINKCTVKCEEDAIQKIDREIDKLVDKCIEESAFNENCQDEKKCKKECKKVAEKREDDVLKKVNNDAIKCKEICRNNAPNDTLLAVDRDVVVVVNNKLSNPSKQDKSAPDETEFRWMELFP